MQAEKKPLQGAVLKRDLFGLTLRAGTTIVLKSKDQRMATDILEYAESVSEKTLEVARKSYDELHERVYKLATVLAAGAGAIGAYALGKVDDSSAIVQWAPLGVLSITWFAIAGVMIVLGSTSRIVSPGNGPDNIRRYYEARLAEQPAGAASPKQDALLITREAELDLKQTRLRNYIAGCNARSAALDFGYFFVAVSPLGPLLAIALLYLR